MKRCPLNVAHDNLKRNALHNFDFCHLKDVYTAHKRFRYGTTYHLKSKDSNLIISFMRYSCFVQFRVVEINVRSVRAAKFLKVFQISRV